jgi:hypothetical protein
MQNEMLEKEDGRNPLTVILSPPNVTGGGGRSLAAIFIGV